MNTGQMADVISKYEVLYRDIGDVSKAQGLRALANLLREQDGSSVATWAKNVKLVPKKKSATRKSKKTGPLVGG
jgi:hypothetical protein